MRKNFITPFRIRPAYFAALFAVFFLISCDGAQKPKEAPNKVPATPITVSIAEAKTIELREEAVGVIESMNAPTISAEVPGKVRKVHVENGASVKAGDLLATLDDSDLQLRVSAAKSDVNRLKTLAENQGRNVARLRSLAGKKVITENQMDDAESQLKALHEQLEGARAMLASAERDLDKTNVRATVGGRVENRMVSVGDFLTPGRPMFMISNEEKYQAHLPFPETVSARIKIGQKVTLKLPVDPGKEYSGVVGEIRPSVNAASKAIDVIIYKDNPGGWKSGASVVGRILVGVREESTVVPPVCVVLRPAGEVVYVVEGKLARQRVVKTGERQEDVVEIIEGLKAGEVVARDGAGFLSDGATVKIAGK